MNPSTRYSMEYFHICCRIILQFGKDEMKTNKEEAGNGSSKNM